MITLAPPLHDLRVPSRPGHIVHLETSCFEMTARKQYFPTIYVLHRRRDYCLGCCFQLFPIICNIWPHLFSFNMHVVVYTVSGHSNTLDMAIHEHSIAPFNAHRQRCHVDCSCTVSCRRSVRGMCSMNTSGFNRDKT